MAAGSSTSENSNGGINDDGIVLFLYIFWICNGRHTFRVLVSDYGLMRDVRPTCL
jgi:hypothetical protein